MKSIAEKMARGYGFFGSGCYNSATFLEFFKSFKTLFKRELKKIGAEKIEISKGHFYLSGFFTLQDTIIYFSISDVRSGFGRKKPNILFRTAKDYKDYTGGINIYIDVKTGMAKDIAKTFGYPDLYEEIAKEKKLTKKSEVETIAKLLASQFIRDGKFDQKLNKKSVKNADAIMWKIVNIITGKNDIGWTHIKQGRKIISSVFNEKKIMLKYYVDSNTIKARRR